MKELRPLTILVAGPIGFGLSAAIPFLFVSLTQTVFVLLLSALVSLPLFGGLAWAVSATRPQNRIVPRLMMYHRLDRSFSAVGLMALLYIVACVVIDLHGMPSPVGEWILISSFFIVALTSLGKVIIHERLRQLYRS